jgi:hypothetical protein
MFSKSASPAAASPAADLNPYESPAEAGGYNAAAAAVIGAWRDGKLLVIHQDAALPPLCIKTGEPAERHVHYVLRWSYPIDLATRRLELDIPFSEAGYGNYCSQRRMAALATSGAAFLLVVSLLLLGNDSLIRTIRFVALILTCTAGGLTGLLWSPLRFVRARGSYLWLWGADQRFLEQLPEWTG